jgi:hypothetical protein
VKRATLAFALASSVVACQSGGRPGEVGVYRTAANAVDSDDASSVTEDASAADAGWLDGASDPDAGDAMATGGCLAGDYEGTYAGFYDTSATGAVATTGALSMRLEPGVNDAGRAVLVATGTWRLALASDLAYPLSLSGTLDCATNDFEGTVAATPGTATGTGVIWATDDPASSSLDGQFVISLSGSVAPVRGGNPMPGVTGSFRATWVRP